ncbi:MAG TPA: RluA family pseudouridine synthase [Pyrinomonadaceae bacterium]|nr:RluA family pseudouridine synthase [Pyrinomonadaceae bacterium]
MEEAKTDADNAPGGGEDLLAFEVTEAEAGERLDAFLAARLEGVSRTTVKRLIEDADVLVDGRASKPSLKLRGGERVEVETPAPPALELAPEEIALDIVYEDEELVVVNKPAGMVVHPAAGVQTGTLANALAYRFQEARISNSKSEISNPESRISNPESRISNLESQISNLKSEISNQQSLRPGIVHRLDRDTSGLIVVAKTSRAHELLSEQFRAREVFKLYVALVHGRVREEAGRIEEPVGRDPRQRTRMAVVARGGREAVSLWRVRRTYDRFTLLDVRIKTGRTHQIRVHLAWLKHPVVGDATYGGGRDSQIQPPRLRARVAALGRQFLHAARLAFNHPRTGERLIFDAPLPVDLQSFLDDLEVS